MQEPTRSGIQIVAVHGAARAAATLAERVGGELLLDEASTRDAIAARLAPHTPRVGDAEIVELRRLAAELRDTEAMPAPPPQSTAVELHTSALREAATMIADIEAELSQLRDRQRELVARQHAEAAAEADDAAAQVEQKENAARRGRMVVTAAIFIVMAVILNAAGAGLLATGLTLVLGVLFVLDVNERHHERLAEQEEKRAGEPVVDDDPPAPEPSPFDDDIRIATERLRAAEDHWYNLAGTGADPHDIGAVLRIRDPQHGAETRTETEPLAPDTESAHKRAEARWRVAWAVLGVEEPPLVDELEAWLAAANAPPVPGAPRFGPMVLLEPTAWLAPELLREVQDVARDVDVYIVIEGVPPTE